MGPEQIRGGNRVHNFTYRERHHVSVLQAPFLKLLITVTMNRQPPEVLPNKYKSTEKTSAWRIPGVNSCKRPEGGQDHAVPGYDHTFRIALTFVDRRFGCSHFVHIFTSESTVQIRWGANDHTTGCKKKVCTTLASGNECARSLNRKQTKTQAQKMLGI
jgi:hypothetical protein